MAGFVNYGDVMLLCHNMVVLDGRLAFVLPAQHSLAGGRHWCIQWV